MLNKRYFARNADGSIKRKQKCETPGCRYPNWHLCFGPTMPESEQAPQGPNWSDDLDRKYERVQAKLAERIALENERNRERDEMIIRDYDRGMTQVAIAKKYHIARNQVRGVLDRREEFVAA